jgi:hypothetical protein
MLRSFLLLCVCLIPPAIKLSAGSADIVSTDSVPNRNTPRGLAEAWLRFHEANLCQGVDAVFVFTKDGMAVRSLIEDERSHEKFQELLAPLRSSYKIEVRETRPPEQKKSEEKREPPPSLWENYELRSFLGDRVARAKERPGFDDNSDIPVLPRPLDTDELLKQRLLVYADQTLAWNRKMERYAKDLPGLTRVALDPALAPDLRARANAVCMMHAQNLDRYIAKLNSSLEPALPRSHDKAWLTQPDKPVADLKTPINRADYLSDSAQRAARRIYLFLYPENYSVGLDELRHSSLLESLKILRTTDSDYQKSLANRMREQSHEPKR